jgi:hypothetical protein
MEAGSLRSEFRGLVTNELIVFPVRHHSPACALQLLRLFETTPPAVVLVEGPRAFTPLVPLLTHADTQAPVAVYTYAVSRARGDNPERRRAAYYPFCDYSPELVALREARRRGIPARFIDLDFSEQFLLNEKADETGQDSLLDESHYRRSQYLQALAEKLGCRDHEELWEHLFETTPASRSLEDFVLQVAVYCQMARIDATDEALAADGTLQREAEMAYHIRSALAERNTGDGPVLAVMGGYHAVVMPQLLAREVSRPSISRGDVSDESASLIRYSFDRLDRLNGYAAGMTSPAWHQDIWTRMAKHERAGLEGVARARQESALAALFDIAAELRERHKVMLPVPALAAAYEQALRLAQLRARAGPVRDDVLDAVTSCFIKGAADADGILVLNVAARVLSGNALGRVPVGAGTPPLVRDFAYRARRQRLRIENTERRHAVLDLYRRPEHRVTSRLLHGLSFLGVPFAVRTAGPDFVNAIGLDRLQEHWEYEYSPITEGALVEASLYGVTLPLAVANRFAAHLEKLEGEGQARNARVAAASVVQASVLGLHDHLPRVLATLRAAIGEDASFDAVAAATRVLGLLWESREPLEARDIPEVPELLQAAYERAIYLGNGLRGISPEHAAPVVGALKELRELTVSAAGQHLDAGLFWEMVATMRAHNDAALLRGAAAGLLHGAGMLSPAALSVELSGHLGGMAQPREAVGYLRGLTQTAREVTWQQPELLKVIDALLEQWDEAAFVATLPEMRLAFAEMTPRETDRIATAVAQLHGLADLGRLARHDVSEAEVAANLILSHAVREVLAGDGLESWTGAT